MQTTHVSPPRPPPRPPARKPPARGLLPGATLSAALAPPVLANPFETTLANGMKLIVKGGPPRTLGGAHGLVPHGCDGRAGRRLGVAHVLEHMMFKGTKEVGPGEFNRRVAAVGGRDNAFTGKDYTAYFQQVPPAHLPTMMALEADRMKTSCSPTRSSRARSRWSRKNAACAPTTSRARSCSSS